MKEAQRIFRNEAVRRYVEGREKSILPRLVSPQTFAYLWLLLGLLAISSFIAWLTKVPIYASGSAVVVRWKDKTQGTSAGIVVAAFFPLKHLSSLQAGRKLFLYFQATGDRLTRPIVTVKPDITSPNDIQKQFLIHSQTAPNIPQPAAVVIAQLEPVPSDLPATAYLGSVASAQIEVGEKRVISLLPLIGKFFE